MVSGAGLGTSVKPEMNAGVFLQVEVSGGQSLGVFLRGQRGKQRR